MITLTMTSDEMHNELMADLGELYKLKAEKQAKVDRRIRRAVKFPVRCKSSIITRRKNHWLVCWVADTRDHINDQCLYYAGCLIHSADGVYLVIPQIDDGDFYMLIFSPHFFRRYSERNRIELKGVELRHHFLLHNNSFSLHPTPQDWTTKYKAGCMATMTDGMALGNSDGTDYNILFRTFISYNMIQEGQWKDILTSEYIRQIIHGYQ